MAYSFTSPSRTSPSLATLVSGGMGTGEAQELVNANLTREYGGGMSKAELQDFDALINRLEASKMRQAGQTNRARQRDIAAGGLASMMANF